MTYLKPFLAGALALACLPALAHPAAGAHAHGFAAGFIHPFTGLDHVLAMLAVGIWSMRQPHARMLPLAFLAMLFVGVVTGVAGLEIPELETGIALSVAVLGVLIFVAARLPAVVGALILAAFAVLHGNAHGHEMPEVASAMGLLLASALLLETGRLLARVSPALLLKLAGAMIAAAGVMLAAAAAAAGLA
ncbi:HupE/UreJ family protein [Rugamonas apoptosis]|uniref:HupE/UreJ family protein n=1 Tax=Rugamonas apoptosis TaxID=2758570 RepID=A0A7W2FFA0_9BURK|nr:HupE/UreJ family protein [Rugamonas apoptosis]MBA5690610.1 HupE/UreJ family protein [Rugamonas apoptosis]